MTAPLIVIRSDAALEIGTGHVRRCLPLARALADRGADVHFICRAFAGHLADEITQAGFAMTLLPAPTSPIDAAEDGAPRLHHAHWLGVSQAKDAGETIAALADIGTPDWLIIDHYALDQRWQTRLRPHATKLMVIDDLADRKHDCDLLLDQSALDQTETRYQDLVPTGTPCLIGPRYALLRDEFANLRKNAEIRAQGLRQVLAFMSGADRTDECLKLLQAIAADPDDSTRYVIIMGGANPHWEDAEKLAATLPHVALHQSVSDMGEHMKIADFAIGAGGSASWERCCLGLPTALIGIADNQQVILDRLPGHGAGFVLGKVGQISVAQYAAMLQHIRANPALLAHMSRQAFAITDGQGARRVADQMIPPPIAIRAATADDCDMLHAWRNHPVIRENAFSTAEIPLESHRQWFAASLENPRRHITIGLYQEAPCGMVRFDLLPAENGFCTAHISIFLSPAHIGKGLAVALLTQAEGWLQAQQHNPVQLIAEVRGHNHASEQLFRNAGYRLDYGTFSKSLAKTETAA